MTSPILINRYQHFWSANHWPKTTSKLSARKQRRSLSTRRTSSQCEHLLPSVVISMDNSMISKSSLKLVESFQTIITFSWVIMLTEDTTLSKLCPCSFAWRSDIQTESPSWEATTKASRSLKSMVSTMNAYVSMETPTSGSTSHLSSTTYLSLLLSKETSSASMVVFLHLSTPSIKSTNSTESWKCQLKVQSVISYGLILMTDAVGVYLQEVLVTHLDKISVNNLTIQMIWNWSLVPISWWWMDTTGRMIETLWRSSQHRTTVTVVVMKQPSWKWTSLWSTLSCSSIRHPIKTTSETWIEGLPTISCEELYFKVL